MAAILVDTNVLVYAHDRGEHAKQQRAIALLAAIQLAGNGRLSAQVLAEFFQATTRGQSAMLTQDQAQEQVERFSRAWPVLDVTSLVVLEAMRGVRKHRLAYWDAQVWAVARLNQIPVVFSEDFASGSTLEGVRFVNPFSPDFVADEWA